MSVTDQAYERSVDVLKQISTEAGFVAADSNESNYRRVFSRDAVISGIAAIQTGDQELINAFIRSLHTLKNAQDPRTGRIPSNVSLDGEKISYGLTVGRIDATLWYVVGVTQLQLHFPDGHLLESFRSSLDHAFNYLLSLELNGRGLIFIPPGADWADEYILSGYVLYDQLLYYLSVKGMTSVYHDEEMKNKLANMAELIRVNYFPHTENINNPNVYHQSLFDQRARSERPAIPLSTFYSPQLIEGHVDNFANALMLHSGILDEEQSEELKRRVIEQFMFFPESILPSFDPIIDEKSKYWNLLSANYRFNFRNQPHEYHNGGAWPLVHGFFLSNLSGEIGEKTLTNFAAKLADENYDFSEFYHGKTGVPGGVKRIGFSASGYIVAYKAIRDDGKIFI